MSRQLAVQKCSFQAYLGRIERKMIDTLREAGPITAEDWRQLALSMRDGLLPPLAKISKKPKTHFCKIFHRGTFWPGSLVIIMCENKHVLSYLLRVRTNKHAVFPVQAL